MGISVSSAAWNKHGIILSLFLHNQFGRSPVVPGSVCHDRPNAGRSSLSPLISSGFKILIWDYSNSYHYLRPISAADSGPQGAQNRILHRPPPESDLKSVRCSARTGHSKFLLVRFLGPTSVHV